MSETIEDCFIKQEDVTGLFDTQTSPPTLYGYPGRTKSTVWKDFGFYMGQNGMLDKTHAICRHCLQGVRYSGNTTNLHTHLTRHKRRHQNAPHGSAEINLSTGSPLSTSFSLYPSQSSSADGENVVTSGQKESYGANNTTTSSPLNVLIAEYLINQMDIPQSVYNSAFVRMMTAADKNFNQEDCLQFYESYITQMYDILTLTLSDIIKNCEAVTVTFEQWKSKSRDDFVTFSAHLINGQWGLESYVLYTKPDCFCNMVEEIEDLLKKWEIPQDMLTVVSGSYDNQGSSFRPNVRNMACLGESINSAARACLALPEVVEIISNIPKQQHLIKNSDDICWGWIPIFNSLSKILKQRNFVTVIDDPSDRSNDSQSLNQQLEDICQVLNPLKLAVDLVCEQAFVISSMILPILKKLEISLSVKTTDSNLLRKMKEKVWNTLHANYKDPKTRNFLLTTSLLDPRYKNLLFVEENEMSAACEQLSMVATELYRQGLDVREEKVICSGENGSSYSIILVQNDQSFEPKMKKIRTLDEEENESNTDSKSDDWLADVVSSKNTPANEVTKEDSVLAEIDRYMTMKQTVNSPFQWWQNRQVLFPTLSRVARSHLCVPATSKPAERLFGTGGFQYDSQRKLVPDEYVNKLVFLNHNYFKLKN